MSEFKVVAATSDLTDPGKITLEFDGRMIVLMQAGGQFYCLDDVCTHDGGPLGDGAFCAADFSLACPRHGAKFDVRTGRVLCMPATENTLAHEVKVEAGKIYVKLRDA